MKVKTAMTVMRNIVNAYDKFEAKKLKIKNRKLKGGNFMKFGTVIGIVVGAIALLAAGAAAMYFYLNKGGCCCCCDDNFDEFDDELFDEFPEEELYTEEPVAEVAPDEDLKF